METGSKQIILSFIEAMNDEDFKAARASVNEDMKFEGVLASRDGAAAYFSDMEKMKMKYEVKKIFGDGDDVCMISDVTSNNVTMLTCSWYQLNNGKISSLKVIFDPRPALAAQK